MPGNNKEIMIGVRPDPQANRGIKQLFDNLQRSAQQAFGNIQKTLQQTWGGVTGQRPGQNTIDPKNSPIVKTFEQLARTHRLNAEGFRAMGKEADGFGKTVRSLADDYERLNKQAQGFRASAAAMRQVGTPTANFQSGLDDMLAKRIETRLAPLVAARNAFSSDQGGGRGGGPGGGGGGGSGAKPPESPGEEDKKKMSKTDMASLAVSIGRSVAGAIQSGANLYQQSKTMQDEVLASARQSTSGRMIREYASGYSPTLWAQKRMVENQHGEDIRDKYLDPTAARVGLRSAQVGGILQSLGGVGAGAAGFALGGGAGLALAGPGAINNITGGIQAAGSASLALDAGADKLTAINTLNKKYDADIAQTPAGEFGVSVLQEEAGMRTAAARKLSGQHMRARGMGWGFGYVGGEAMGIAESLQRSGGAGSSSAMFDSRGNRGILRNTFALGQAGIDVGAAGGALTSMTQSLGGSAAASERAMQAVERAVAAGTQRGFTDPRTREELVSAMGQAASTRILDGTGGLERMAAFMGIGHEGIMGMADIQGRQRAIGAMDQAGQSPYMQSVYAAQAKMMLGSNADIFNMTQLSGSSTAGLLTGGAQMSSAGVTSGQRATMLRQRMADMLLSVNAGVDLTDKKSVFDTISLRKEMFGDDRAAKQFTEMFSGLDQLGSGASDGDLRSLSKKGGGVLDRFGDPSTKIAVAADQFRVAAGQLQEVSEKLAKGVDIKSALEDLKKAEDQERNPATDHLVNLLRTVVFQVRNVGDIPASMRPSNLPSNPKGSVEKMTDNRKAAEERFDRHH